MKAPPLIPQSGRNRTDLDALIDQSIGQKRKFDELGEPHLAQSAVPENHAPSIATPQPVESVQARPAQTEPVDRFQAYLPRVLITALKLEAVRQRLSPSAVLEIALRRYLDMDGGN